MKRKDTRYRTITFDYDDIDIEPNEEPTATAPQRHEEPDTAPSPLYYISLGSGSSGNCAYVGHDGGGVLIDAGIDPAQVFPTLLRNGVDLHKIAGIVLTHDHQDHVRYVYRYVRDHKHLRVYCTPRLLGGLLRRHNISRRVKDFHESIFKEIPFKLAGMEFTAFETSHDGTDNMGFSIAWNDRKFVVATDMGIITPRAEHYMAQANYLMIESNYDSSMLEHGRYPEMLKDRVRGERGHLDNEVTVHFVTEHLHPGLRHLFLCHLSKDNNTPDIALRVMTDALMACGLTVGDGTNAVNQRDRDIQLAALPRYTPSPWYILG